MNVLTTLGSSAKSLHWQHSKYFLVPLRNWWKGPFNTNAGNPHRFLLTVLVLAVNDRQVPLLLSAECLSRGPVGPHVVFLALEQEALVPEKLPAWRKDRKKRNIRLSR